jgi:sterol desaturase/sphingolipid hydroxylase (fatty acid hydroxylase superfamily)
MRLSTISYYADFFLAAGFILFLAASMAPGLSAIGAAQAAGCVAAGFALWTALEYFVHRVLYHHVPFFRELHDAHHQEPRGFIGAPPVIGIALILAITYLPVVMVHEIAAQGMTIGMLAGYMGYMLLHHSAHHWNPRKGSWLWRARRHHALHHHLGLEGNYGIVTSFWDHVFGTALQPGRQRPSPERA